MYDEERVLGSPLHTFNTLLFHEIEGGAAASGNGPPSRLSLKRSLSD